MKKFGIVKLLLLCLMVAVVSAVPTLAVAEQKKAGIEENLKGNISSFQGILTVWNVDTFEGGSQSKSVMLERAGSFFSSENQGLYFLVKNLSVEEMTQNFMQGIYPDILSFGYGIGNIVEPILEDISGIETGAVRGEILNSGSTDTGLKAVGYLMGGYLLATTEEKLLSAGKLTDTSLLSLVNLAGFNTEGKTGLKHTASVVLGENKYISSNTVVETGFGTKLEDYFLSASMYDAYLDFVGYNKGTLLLGTHRDLFKLSGRIAVGKISGVKIEMLEGYTNLVQYIGVTKGLSEEKRAMAISFVEYLLTEEAQKLSTKVGMINTIKASFYEQGEFKQLEDTLNKDLVIPGVFS